MNGIQKNIFSQRCPELVRLFNHAEKPEKVLCIPIDYAKQKHVGLGCNGLGNILKGPFVLDNNPKGVSYLLKIVDDICKKHNIAKKHVVIGGEDCGTFADNFIYSVTELGYSVFRTNAHKAKLQRENMKASTDNLDLLGIAGVFLNRQGHLVRFPDTEQLQQLCRHRHTLVQNSTALSNQIHAISDQLFPGFLDTRKSGIPPFTSASLYLMSDHFSPQQICCRKLKSLVTRLQNEGIHEPIQAAEKLKAFASTVLHPNPARVDTLQQVLADQVTLLKTLQSAITNSELFIGNELAKNPGAFATTIRGAGIVLAAQLTAELGQTNGMETRQLVSYAGIVPGVKQTGGPEKEASTTGCPRSYNHLLKDTVMQLAQHMGMHGPEDLLTDFHRRKNNQQNAEFGMARRCIRTYLYLVRHGSIYLPERLRSDASRQELSSYYVKLWPALRRKWNKVGAAKAAFDSTNPLGAWRDCVQSLYNIELPLRGNKAEIADDSDSTC